MDTGSTSTDNLIESLTNTLALLNQSFKAHLPQTNNQLRTSSNQEPMLQVQDDMSSCSGCSRCVDTCRIIKKDHFRGTMQEEKEMLKLGMKVVKQEMANKLYLCDDPENGVVLDEEQLLFLVGEQVTNFDELWMIWHSMWDMFFDMINADAFDSDVMRLPPHRPCSSQIFHQKINYDEAGII
ncbi:hypothetical protein Tco_0428970 [Tanacetum coccineum]